MISSYRQIYLKYLKKVKLIEILYCSELEHHFFKKIFSFKKIIMILELDKYWRKWDIYYVYVEEIQVHHALWRGIFI